MRNIFNKINELAGNLAAFLVLLMIFTAVLVVFLRYGFNLGFVWMQELYVWLHGIIFLIGAGYSLKHNKHVRVDIFYEKFSNKYKAIVNIAGSVLLLFPMLFVILWTGFPYIKRSWDKLEASYQAGGMEGVFLLKSSLLIFCFLLFIQALVLIADAIKSVREDKQ